VLLDLLRDKEMPERMAEAWALCAEARMAVGESEAALEAVRQTLAFAKASPDGDARIRSARILGALGQTKEALAALPRPEELPANPVDDPAAQLAALRARLIAADAPDTARDLATWVAVRPPALLGLRAAQIAIDAANALAAVGDIELSRTTAKKGLKALQPNPTASRPGPPPTEGLVLELLLVMQRAAPDERVGAAARQVTERIAEGLPGPFAASFRKRRDLG
jgi:tetratricopeptide (TPR) repeat protein